MKKVLVYFGYKESWSNIYNKHELLKYLGDIIYDIKVFKTIDDLRNYLNKEGQNFKNYILPVRVEDIIKLNNANINSLFKIETTHLLELDNKKLFSKFVEKYNLKKFVPKYYTETSKGKKLVVLKPHKSGFSSGIYKKKLCEVTTQEFQNYVVQKYIFNSKEYAGYFVSHNGKITYSFAFERDFGNGEYIKIHDPCLHEKIVQVDNDTIKSVEKFLRPYKYTGASCFDYKIVDGKISVFEVNPRLGGSLSHGIYKELSEIVRELVKIYDKQKVFN
jgi:predicted ATP-grasp superfamily ATP-dependent carboligase